MELSRNRTDGVTNITSLRNDDSSELEKSWNDNMKCLFLMIMLPEVHRLLRLVFKLMSTRLLIGSKALSLPLIGRECSLLSIIYKNSFKLPIFHDPPRYDPLEMETYIHAFHCRVIGCPKPGKSFQKIRVEYFIFSDIVLGDDPKNSRIRVTCDSPMNKTLTNVVASVLSIKIFEPVEVMHLKTFEVIFAMFVLPEFSTESIISISLINMLPIIKIAMQFNCYRKICRNATRNSAVFSTEALLKQMILALLANIFTGCAFGIFLWKHWNHSATSLILITVYVLLSQGKFLPVLARPSTDHTGRGDPGRAGRRCGHDIIRWP